MRIGIVTGEYPPMQGGVGAYSHILARTFTNQGHQIFVFTADGAENPASDVGMAGTANGWGLGTLRAVNRWARENNLDVLNLQFQTAAFQMSPWIHFLPHLITSSAVVTTFHDLRFPYLFPKAGRLRDWIVMHLARASSGVIVTNHEDFARVQTLPCVALVPIGSNIMTPPPPNLEHELWRRRAGAANGEFLLGYFGFANRSKGMETLLRSMAQLRAESFPVRLVLIGGRTGASDPSNTAYANEIDGLIGTLGMKQRVYRTGYVDDQTVSAYLTACDVVVLPYLDGASYRRGSLMAAIQHGCAIITTRPQVEIPQFADGDNMLLIPPGDSVALSDAVHTLYASPAATPSPTRRTRASTGGSW